MTDYSYQLYSSRNFQPLEKTLNLLASLGYVQVEGFGGLFEESTPASATELKASLDNAGLSMPSSHLGFEQLEGEFDQTMALLGTIGISTVFVPFLAESERSDQSADWIELAHRLEKLHESYAKEGITIGWHNHAFEFNATESGDLPLDLLLQNAPSIALEFDIAWAVVARQDPLAWLERYSNRIAAAHLKDLAATGDCADEDGWADVGHGTMDWKALHAAVLNTDARYLVMEHDNPNDHERFASRSIAYCQSL